MSVVDPFEDIERRAIQDAQAHDIHDQSKFFMDEIDSYIIDNINHSILKDMGFPSTPKQKRPVRNNMVRKGWYDPHKY